MHRLATTLDEVRATRSKKRKVTVLAELWRTLDVDTLSFCLRLLLGQALPGRSLGVGWALASAAAARVSGRSETEVGLLSRELGDFGDALAQLLPEDRSLPLAEVPAALEAIATAVSREEKQSHLEHLLSHASGSEARYLGRALMGELRIGVQASLLEESLAEAFGRPLEAVRKAASLLPDLGHVAMLARADRLAEAMIEPGRPVAFMLATPIEQVKSPVDPALTVVEDKLDGVRTQVHVSQGTVRLFARGLDDVTSSFPGIAHALSSVRGTVILDGELIAVGPDGRARPFQALQRRLGAKGGTVPVEFVAFDCLYADRPLLQAPWTERRACLESLGLRCNPARPLDPSRLVEPQLDEAFTQARARGNEGLMLKRTDSVYEAGSRGASWRKVKRAWATLDVVITRAERGHGRRAGVLSDYTFAVWADSTLQDIGKAYSGLTDLEITALSRRLDELTTRRDGPVQDVEPRVVLEVAFDGLQRSTRHASGFALRFPRIVRVRDDKQAAQADRLETVEALWKAQVASGHREEAPPDAQLSLFKQPKHMK